MLDDCLSSFCLYSYLDPWGGDNNNSVDMRLRGVYIVRERKNLSHKSANDPLSLGFFE